MIRRRSSKSTSNTALFDSQDYAQEKLLPPAVANLSFEAPFYPYTAYPPTLTAASITDLSPVTRQSFVVNGLTYESSSSTVASGNKSAFLFDSNLTNTWASASSYSLTTGEYVGAFSTSDTSGNAWTGEWLELVLPSGVKDSIDGVGWVHTDAGGIQANRQPLEFVVLGSANGGSTYDFIQQVTGNVQTQFTATGLENSVNLTFNGKVYDRMRVVFTKIHSGGVTGATPNITFRRFRWYSQPQRTSYVKWNMLDIIGTFYSTSFNSLAICPPFGVRHVLTVTVASTIGTSFVFTVNEAVSAVDNFYTGYRLGPVFTTGTITTSALTNYVGATGVFTSSGAVTIGATYAIYEAVPSYRGAYVTNPTFNQRPVQITAGIAGDWFEVEYAPSLQATGYIIGVRNTNGTDSPSRFVVLGSMNRQDWTIVDDRRYGQVASITATTTFRTYRLTKPAIARYFRIVVTEVNNGVYSDNPNGGSSTRAQGSCWQMRKFGMLGMLDETGNDEYKKTSTGLLNQGSQRLHRFKAYGKSSTGMQVND